MADTVRIVSVIFLNILNPITSDFSSVDLTTCKLTHRGTEYFGNISKTETNANCQFWNSIIHKGSEQLLDKAFPDGSKVLAKNYCRNPNKNPKGPWCYTTQPKLISDTCRIPLCKTNDCRISGTGMEYTGPVHRSASGKLCTAWKEIHRVKGTQKEPTFGNKYFGDGSAGEAQNKCRNPDGNLPGPWCYVERDNSELHVKELCDVPFCDDLETVMYSEGSLSGGYFFYSNMNESRSFNINFRLWNPADWLGGEVYLHLSAYDIAANRDDVERWSSGVEILLSHTGSGILGGEEDTLTETPHILSGGNWTKLHVNWTDVDNRTILVQVFQKPELKPVARGEILKRGTIFEVESFRYFSLSGSPSIWKVESAEEECFVHTVSKVDFTRFWLIRKTTLSKDVDIFVRAHKDAIIMLRTAPMVATSQVQIRIGVKDYVKVFTYDNKDSPRQLSESSWPHILNFWSWENFKIKLVNDKLQLFWVHQGNTELVIETIHPNIARLLWVTFASPVVSYWTIYCDPRGTADPPLAAPPECVSKESELFNGTLSVTKKGRQCIPWTDTSSIPKKYHDDELFAAYGGKPCCQNFCRNLDNDPAGAFCFVRDVDSESGFGLEHCRPRFCNMGDCKLAGTGNDYIGHLNKTRSRRYCKPWVEVADAVVDINNFPDPTLEDAGNFCRNPSKSVTGTWCFTNDWRVPKDSCYVNDCDKPLQCTVLTTRYMQGTFLYILPRWRKHGLEFWLKAWNPDIYEGFIISLLSLDRVKEYTLIIGDEDNEKVRLIHSYQGLENVLLQKTLPHLVPTGKWGGYWLRTGPGKIELGYQGEPNSFFEWASPNQKFSFEPMYINFGTTQGNWIGVNFKCTECLHEHITVRKNNKMFPINLWKDSAVASSLRLNLRGSGSVFVNLMWFKDFGEPLSIKIDSSSNYISLIRTVRGNIETLASFRVNDTIASDKWSKFVVSFTEDSLTLHKNGVHLFEWSSPFPLLFYWFSVTSSRGWVVWSANCPAADIDGKPRDGNWGNWGPWSCSVTCGRGVGRTERPCNNPRPNVYGKDCKGSPVYEGPCNDFPCGEISPETSNRIRHYLSTQHKSRHVEASEKVVLQCNPQAVSQIIQEVSEVNITWTHNGFPYSRTKFHMDENFGLVISRAHEKHNGIYLCLVYQSPESILPKIVLEVISLVVKKSKPTKKIRQGRSMTLKSNGIALSYVYADLSQRWELNGIVWKDYGMGSIQTFPVDKLENVSHSHAGIWTCVITQEDLGFKWTTNWILLSVKSAPSFWSYLMEDVATAPTFGKLDSEKYAMLLFFAILGVFLAIIVMIIFGLVKCLRSKPT